MINKRIERFYQSKLANTTTYMLYVQYPDGEYKQFKSSENKEELELISEEYIQERINKWQVKENRINNALKAAEAKYPKKDICIDTDNMEIIIYNKNGKLFKQITID